MKSIDCYNQSKTMNINIKNDNNFITTIELFILLTTERVENTKNFHNTCSLSNIHLHLIFSLSYSIE